VFFIWHTDEVFAALLVAGPNTAAASGAFCDQNRPRPPKLSRTLQRPCAVVGHGVAFSYLRGVDPTEAASARESGFFFAHQDPLRRVFAFGDPKMPNHPSMSISRRPQVQARTGIPKATMYAMMAMGAFPKPIKIGVRAVAWLDSDIDKWIEARAVASKKGDL